MNRSTAILLATAREFFGSVGRGILKYWPSHACFALSAFVSEIHLGTRLFIMGWGLLILQAVLSKGGGK